ncbi:MAG: TlpA disulfide reductase family protein [Bacteroidota bacterium]
MAQSTLPQNSQEETQLFDQIQRIFKEKKLMQRILLFAFSLLFLLPYLHAQNTLQLTANFKSCQSDSLYLFVPDGSVMRPQVAIPVKKDSGQALLSAEIKGLPDGFYYLGGGQQNNTFIFYMEGNERLAINGQCKNLSRAAVKSSGKNHLYQSVQNQINQHQQSFSKLLTSYQRSKRKPAEQESIVQSMAEHDQRQLQFLDSIGQIHPLMKQLVGLHTYLSFQNQAAEGENEAQYFARNFFHHLDLSDPKLGRIPHFFGRVASYSQTLSKVGLSSALQREYASGFLKQIPANTLAHEAASLGIAAGFQQGDETAFVQFTEAYIQQYADKNPAAVQSLGSIMERAKSNMIGAEAQEIRLPNLEGDTLQLSDLRGKYVLIDFWASWCGPCRRENPNVKRVYENYKDKGFEILGVSLDNNHSAWEKAVVADGLQWLHVSDLKRFRSAAAQAYGVPSIPHTVLIDPDGKIIARRLRGATLEQKLADLLGD